MKKIKFKQNESTLDRLIRFIVAEIVFIIAFFWLYGIAQILLYILVVIIFITGITGFCGIYKLFEFKTNKHNSFKITEIIVIIWAALFILIAILGSYYSNSLTRKLFIKDYNTMNQHYVQTLFYLKQNKLAEALDSYNKLEIEYDIFNNKYQKYHSYVISGDKEFNADLTMVLNTITNLKDKMNKEDLKTARKDIEQIRVVFKNLFVRNGFTVLSAPLIDFNDSLEKIISKANKKDAIGLIEAYPEVSDKLKVVEEIAGGDEIQNIRNKLEEIVNLAKGSKIDDLSMKAKELKNAYVKVYLKLG